MELRRGTQRAKQLRTTPTDAENALWTQLRAKRLCGFKFRRQFPINGYVVDFVCLECKLVIEVDGSQHGDALDCDAKRTTVLRKNGFRVLRFWNNEVLQQLDSVLAEILTQLHTPPSPQPSPASGRGG